MQAEIPFAVQVGESTFAQNSREVLVNMYAQVVVSGRRQLVRKQRAGLRSIHVLAGVKRAIEKFEKTHYIVAGNRFYSYDGTDVIELGVLSSLNGLCSLAYNDNGQVLVCDGLRAYVWDGVVFTEIITPEGASSVASMSGFGIISVPNSGRFYITGLNDFKTIDALDFATAEANPDKLVRIYIDHNEVWLFGTVSTEIWQLSGNADFPFARFSNAQIERGCIAPFSVAADDNTVFWLGDDKVVYRADGYRPLRVSNSHIEDIIGSIPQDVVAEARAFFTTIKGNKFYTITFPNHHTLQYNVATNFWNSCKSFGFDDWQVWGEKRSDYLLTRNGLAALDDTLSTDEGVTMARGGVCAPIWANGNRIALREFFLDAEVGRADISKPTNIMLRIARDGETFQNERWRNLGKIGEYMRRAIWRNLGYGRRITVEVLVTDPVQFEISGTRGNLVVGAS